MMGRGEKPRNIQKTNAKTKEKFPVWFISHPPCVQNGDRLFSGVRKTPKTSQTYPRWERDPSLVGQKIQGWVWYGQLKADNMIFIHVNFQDLQQKRAGVRVEVKKIMGMGKILETNN